MELSAADEACLNLLVAQVQSQTRGRSSRGIAASVSRLVRDGEHIGGYFPHGLCEYFPRVHKGRLGTVIVDLDHLDHVDIRGT